MEERDQLKPLPTRKAAPSETSETTLRTGEKFDDHDHALNRRSFRSAPSNRLFGDRFGGFGELNEAVKLHRKIGASLKDGKYETLDRLYSGSSSVTWLEEKMIKFKAQERSIRQFTAAICGFFVCWLVVCNVIFVAVAEMTIPDALLYTMYSITSTGFGSVEIPHTPGFLIFIIIFMFIGIAFLVLSAAVIYLDVSLEASHIKRRFEILSSPRQGSQEAGNGATTVQQGGLIAKVVSPLLSCSSFLSNTVRTKKYGRPIVFGGYLIFQLLLGTLVMMHFENWSFVMSLYYATYVMTTVGYGDVTPITSGGTWFTICWLPFNVTFVCIYMGNLAHYFKIATTEYRARVYNRLLSSKYLLPRNEVVPSSNIIPQGSDNRGVTARDTQLLHTMKDVLELALEAFSYEQSDHGEDAAPVITEHLKLQSPWNDSGTFHVNKVRKPSLALQILMQERLASIIAQEVAGVRSEIGEKDLTFLVSLGSLQDTIAKWNIPAGAHHAFALVAFEIMLYIGEKRLIVEGANAILELSPSDCHKLFSPVLAAFENAGTMEGWLALTEELAASCSSLEFFSQPVTKSVEGKDGTDAEVELDRTSGEKLFKYNSDENIVILRSLSSEYDRSMEEIQISNIAGHQSNRTIAWGLVTFMLIYQTAMTTFFILYADLKVNMGILFTLYTITSAGFGNVVIPKSDGFLGLLVVNVFISISLLAALVAQCVFYLQFEAVRRKHSQDKIVIGRRGQAVLARLVDPSSQTMTVRDVMRIELSKAVQMIPNLTSDEKPASQAEKLWEFLFDTHRGRAVVVAVILITLLLLGTFAMMIFEGWTFIEGFYFATYGLLTVGHGDLTPVTNAGLWFTDFWLPFNVLFVALYLGSVTHLFVRAHNLNTDRIERTMLNAAKMRSAANVAAAQCDETEMNNRAENPHLRTRIKQNSSQESFFQDGIEIVTVRDLLKKIDQPKPLDVDSIPLKLEELAGGEGVTVVFSPKYQALMQNANKDDHFALRLKVLDRVARIVSAQLLDFDAILEVDGDSLRVTVDSLKDWSEEWKIPRQARATYREVSFEALLFVGEKQVFEHGVGAFLNIKIVEFIELFSPFVFALETTETMNEWLTITDDLARERLPCGLEDDFQEEIMQEKSHRRTVKSTVDNFFPLNPGNAIRMKIQ